MFPTGIAKANISNVYIIHNQAFKACKFSSGDLAVSPTFE